MRETLYSIGEVLRRWLIAQSLLALVVALIVGAGLLALGAPFAVQLLESYLLAPLVQHKAVDVGGLGVAVATPLAAAALVAINMLYVQDVLGEKPAARGSG